MWCGVNRLDDSGVHTLGDTSAFVNPTGQLLLTRRGKTRMVVSMLANVYCVQEQNRQVFCKGWLHSEKGQVTRRIV